MHGKDRTAIAPLIIDRAKSLGASLAGIASVDLLKKSPSHEIYGKIEPNRGVGSRDYAEGVEPGKIAWPPAAKSALVIAVVHQEKDPHLDWFIEQDGDRESPGCRLLQDILDEVAAWAQEQFGLTPHRLPYHLEKGGIFFKDAGVLAGFGTIGKNNLLVTPQYGPRVRVWPLLFDEELPPTGPVIYDPCDGCPQPCRQACPRNAFAEAVHSPIAMGMITLPGRDGCYDREKCRPETEKNLEEKELVEIAGYEEPVWVTKFCRLCELSCPVGKG